MKRKPPLIEEDLQLICLRDELCRQMLRDGSAPDSKVAYALAHNEALRIILSTRKREGSAKGGKETRKNRKAPELDRLIRGQLDRGRDPRVLVRDWADAYGLSPSQIYRRINEAEAQK